MHGISVLEETISKEFWSLKLNIVFYKPVWSKGKYYLVLYVFHYVQFTFDMQFPLFKTGNFVVFPLFFHTVNTPGCYILQILIYFKCNKTRLDSIYSSKVDSCYIDFRYIDFHCADSCIDSHYADFYYSNSHCADSCYTDSH